MMAMGYGMPGQAWLMQVWAQADRNRSGRISARELQAALRNGTWAPFNAETIWMMIAMFDVNGDWKIDFMEFQRLWQHLCQWQHSFMAYDRNRSGSIDFAELTNALWANGYQVTPQFGHYIVMKMDRTKSGQLLFDDYIKLCITLQILTAAFRAKDMGNTGMIHVGYEEFLTMALLPRL